MTDEEQKANDNQSEPTEDAPPVPENPISQDNKADDGAPSSGESLDKQSSEGQDTNGESGAATTSDGDATANQPESKKKDFFREGIDREKKVPPDVHLRRCMTRFFSVDDLKGCCQYYIGGVLWREVQKLESHDVVASKLIDYCNRHGKTQKFWDFMQEERPTQYKDQYEKWLKAVQSAGEDMWAQYNMYEEPGGHNRQSDEQDSDKKAKPHPLTTDDMGGIRHWFFEELDESTQSFTLTVGLFEGMSRHNINAVADLLANRLFEDTSKS